MTLPSYDHDHENDVIYFARTNFRNQLRKFGIKTDDRRRHMYLIGKTGVGKTTLLENMVLADIYKGHGVGVVDPHGDFAEKIIDYIPEHRVQDIVYFNPADIDWPVAFNILESVDDAHKHLIASGLMGVFKKIWPDVWSARMEHILNNCILTLLEQSGNTLLGINRLLVDQHFRRNIIVNLRDPVVKAFWITEFEQWDVKFRAEAIAPIQNKVGQFLSTSLIRNIVGQPTSTIKPREIMDQRKIFIINLAKGRIGEDASRLVGGMLITKMQLAAMERVDMLEPDRQDFYLYIDEFQNFATESFANILSEARKYRLALIMAHQYIEQLEEEVAAAVFGNVGTLISYRVGAADAEKLAVEFAPRFTEEDLVNLPKFNVYLKLMIDGIASDPFSAITLPPIAARTHSTEAVVAVTHKNFSRREKDVARSIVEWSETRHEPSGSTAEALAALPPPKPMKKLNEYDCTRCGKKILLPVELDRSRPIYCETCIEIVRAERKAGKREEVKKEVKDEKGKKDEKVEMTKGASLDALSVKVPETKKTAILPVVPKTPEVAGKGEAVTAGQEKKRKRKRRKRHGGGQDQKTAAVSVAGAAHIPQPISGGDELFPW